MSERDSLLDARYLTVKQALIDSGTNDAGELHPVAQEALKALDELVASMAAISYTSGYTNAQRDVLSMMRPK